MLSALVCRSSPLKIVTGSFVTTFYHGISPCKTFLRLRVPAFYLETCTILSSAFGIGLLQQPTSPRVSFVQLCYTTDVFLGSIIYLHTDCSWKSNAWRISNHRGEGRGGRKRRKLSYEVDVSNNTCAKFRGNYNLPICYSFEKLACTHVLEKEKTPQREYFPRTNVWRTNFHYLNSNSLPFVI